MIVVVDQQNMHLVYLLLLARMARRRRKWMIQEGLFRMRPYITPLPVLAPRFDFNRLPDHLVKRWFRFSREEINLLVEFFDLEGCQIRYRYKVPAIEMLCIVCLRLSYPQRLFQMSEVFGRSKNALSVIFNDVLIYLSKRYRNTVKWSQHLTFQRLQTYAQTIGDFQGIEGGFVCGFVDGTFKPFCRPEEDQRLFYSGYKHLHGMKYQVVSFPDGLAMVDGPYEGTMNDLTMARTSSVEDEMARIHIGIDDEQRLFLYGDSAYMTLNWVFGPYLGAALTEGQREFNRELSSIRISVEQIIGRTQSLWSGTAFKIGLKSGLMPVAAFFEVSALLTNCHTCLHGNLISSRFSLAPPSLQEYLARPEEQNDEDNKENDEVDEV